MNLYTEQDASKDSKRIMNQYHDEQYNESRKEKPEMNWSMLFVAMLSLPLITAAATV